MSTLAIARMPKALLGLSIVIFFALIISEIPLRVSLISTLFVMMQIFSGAAIFVVLTKKTDLTWQEYSGIGLVIGSLLSIVLDQLFRTSFISDYAWLLALPTVLFLVKKKTSIENTTQTNHTNQFVDYLILFCASFLFITTDWFWVLPLVIFVAAIIWWIEFGAHRRYSITLALLSAPITVYAFLTRPTGWWIEDSDVALYEAISQTLKVWGATDNINGSGTPTNYHWLVYAWSGLLERISDAPNWIVNTRVIPLLVSLGIALLIWSILFRLGHSRKVIFLSILLVGFYDSVPTWGRGFAIGYTPSPSQMYGLLLILAFIYLLIAINKDTPKQSLILFFIIGIGAIGAKVPHGAIVAGASGILLLSIIFKTKKLFSNQSLQLIFTIFGVIIGFVVIIGGLSNSSRSMIIDQVAFVNGITGDFRPYSIYVRWIAATIFIFGFYAVPILGLIQISQLKSPENLQLRIFLAGIGISGLFGTIFLSAEFAVELFFSHASSSAIIIMTAPVLITQYQSLISQKKLLNSILIIGFLSAILLALAPKIPSRSYFGGFLRLVPSLAGLVPITCVFIGVFFIYKLANPIKASIQFALFGLFAMSLGFFAVNFAQNSASEYPEFKRNFESRTGLDRPDLISASNWISENTNEATIFATNDFCSEISPSCNAQTDWDARVNFSMNCTQDQVVRWVETDDCNPGGYNILTALVDRRFLAGNFWVGISDGDALQPWVAQRVLDSVGFAKNPSVDVVNSLKLSDVGWFLLRSQLTDSKDWQKFGTIEYSNDSYVVIKLN